MGYVLGLDLGTSFFKCSIINKKGKCLATGRVPTPMKKVQVNVVTLSVDVFWQSIKNCIQEAITPLAIENTEIEAISYASQANTFILLDTNTKPLTELITWTSHFYETLPPELASYSTSAQFKKDTGMHSIDTGSLVSNYCWIKHNLPEVFQKTAHILTISDFLIWGLTGNFFSDTSTSSLLGLLELKKAKWSLPSLAASDIHPEQLGMLLPVGSFAGCTTTSQAKELGLDQTTRLYCGGLDHLIAAYGAGIGALSQTSESTGTVLAVLTIKDTFKPKKDILLGLTNKENHYSYLSFFDKGAQAIQTLHDCMFSTVSYEQMSQQTQTTTIGANHLSYDDETKTFQGMTAENNNPQNKLRAIYETIAFRISQLRDYLAVEEENKTIVATGGGNKCDELLQIKADMWNCTILTCKEQELGAYGAAMIAAYGLSWFSSIEAAQTSWITLQKKFIPNRKNYQTYRQWKQKRIAQNSSTQLS